jgi:hypothetical protein
MLCTFLRIIVCVALKSYDRAANASRAERIMQVRSPRPYALQTAILQKQYQEKIVLSRLNVRCNALLWNEFKFCLICWCSSLPTS